MVLPAPKLGPVPVSIRVGYASDLHFIGDTWVRTLLRMGHNSRSFDFFNTKLADVMAHVDRASVLIAHHEEDPEDIVSYLVSLYRGGVFVVHFAYTKELARRQGVVRRLLETANPLKLPMAFTNPAKNKNVMDHFCRRAIFDAGLWGET